MEIIGYFSGLDFQNSWDGSINRCYRAEQARCIFILCSYKARVSKLTPVLTYRCIFPVETLAYKNVDFCHNAWSELLNTHKPASVGSCLGSAGANFNMVIFFWQLYWFCFAAVMLVLVLVHWHLHWMFKFCLLYMGLFLDLQVPIKSGVYMKHGNEDMKMKLCELTMSIYNKWLNITKKPRNTVNLAKNQIEYIKICSAIKLSL